MQFLSVQQLQQFQLNSVKSKQCSSVYDSKNSKSTVNPKLYKYVV